MFAFVNHIELDWIEMNLILEKRFKESIELSDHLTREQAAFYIGCSLSSLNRRVNAKQITKYYGKGTGVRPYFKKEELDKFIDNGKDKYKYNPKDEIND